MTLIANTNGEIRGKFAIPAKVPSGAKAVVFRGRGGSEATASFVGQGTLTVSNVIQARTITRYWTDPLAQTFALTAQAQVCGVDLWFTARGQSAVRVQIRDTDNGYPGKSVLTETRLAPEALVITGGGHTRALFPAPVSLAADTEYAIVVMCDDAETALAIAELGQFDATRQYYVAGQPYQVGVLFSSSNASAWTPHQEKDLAFRILEADFTATAGELPLGGADVTEATDMLVMALEDLPRAEIAARALADWSAVAVLPDMEAAIALANRIAPEHLEILTATPWELLPRIRHAGAVFLGPYSPEPLGDYFAGPNHVLPTLGTARFSSALSVQTFCKRTSVIAASAAFAASAAEPVARLARMECLEAHARSIEARAQTRAKDAGSPGCGSRP